MGCDTLGRALLHGSREFKRQTKHKIKNVFSKKFRLIHPKRNKTCDMGTSTEQGRACLGESICQALKLKEAKIYKCRECNGYLSRTSLEQGMACPSLSMRGSIHTQATKNCFLTKYG